MKFPDFKHLHMFIASGYFFIIFFRYMQLFTKRSRYFKGYPDGYISTAPPKWIWGSNMIQNNCAQFVLNVPQGFQICAPLPCAPYQKQIWGGSRNDSPQRVLGGR